MEQHSVWIAVIGTLSALLTTIVGAVLAAMKMMWNRIGFLQDAIQQCEKLHAASEAMVGQLEARIRTWEAEARDRTNRLNHLEEKVNGEKG
jgi:CHAD domain-containing protein